MAKFPGRKVMTVLPTFDFVTPADNPALPSWMDTYTPSIAGSPAATPAIAQWTKQGRAGDVINLTGLLTSAAFDIFGQSTANDKSLLPATILEATNNNLAAIWLRQVPDSMLLLCPKVGAAYGKPMPINRTEAMWVQCSSTGQSQGFTGDTVAVFGQNLAKRFLSATGNWVGTGTRTWNIKTGLTIPDGTPVFAIADGANSICGTVATSGYNSSTGDLTINTGSISTGMPITQGSGYYTSWSLYLCSHCGVWWDNGDGTKAFIMPTFCCPYMVEFTMPTALAVGTTHNVWLHNGMGGQYGWSTSLALKKTTDVVLTNDWASYVESASMATPTGTTDDAHFTTAKTNVAANAPSHGSGGAATILFGSGTYAFANPLHVNNIAGGISVLIKGQGIDVTFITAAPGFPASPGYFWVADAFYAGIQDCTIDMTANFTSNPSTPNPAVLQGGVWMKNVKLIMGSGFIYTWNPDPSGFGGSVMTGCTFTGSPIYYNSGIYYNSWIRQNLFIQQSAAESAIFVYSGSNCNICNNTSQDLDVNTDGNCGQGRFYFNQGGGQDLGLIAGNSFSLNGNPSSSDLGKGENICWEGCLGTQSSLATAATANTVTLSNVSTGWIGGTLPRASQGRMVVITGGQGVGQWANIIGVTLIGGGPSGILTLDRNFQVIPDTSTSIISIVCIPSHIFLYNNSQQHLINVGSDALSLSSATVKFYVGAIDCVMDGVSGTNTHYGVSTETQKLGGALTTPPAFFNLCQNIKTIGIYNEGVQVSDGGIFGSEVYTHLGNIYRNINNVGTPPTYGAFIDNRRVNNPTVAAIDLVAFDKCSFNNEKFGIAFGTTMSTGTDTVIVSGCTFTRGSGNATAVGYPASELAGTHLIKANGSTATGFDLGNF